MIGMERCKKYYLAHAGQTVVALFSGALTFGLCTALKTTARVPLLFLRAAICIAVPNAIFIAVFCRTARFKYALHIITRR